MNTRRWLAWALSLTLLAALPGIGSAQSEPTVDQIYQAANAGQLPQAQQMVDQVLRSHPDSAKAHYVKAELSARQRDGATAQRELATAERLAPGLPFARPAAVQALRTQVQQLAAVPRRTSRRARWAGPAHPGRRLPLPRGALGQARPRRGHRARRDGPAESSQARHGRWNGHRRLRQPPMAGGPMASTGYGPGQGPGMQPGYGPGMQPGYGPGYGQPGMGSGIGRGLGDLAQCLADAGRRARRRRNRCRAAALHRREKRKRIFAIVAASSGNLVEWFDFYIYAFSAIYFAPAFFPKSDPTAQLLNTAGVFAAGFLMRPIGGWLFGRIADRRGRKASLLISVVMMCGGSLLIASLPTYASIGAWAPALLLFARLVQGLSVGGEYGATATYMSEVAMRGQRGFYSSFQYVTLIGGQLLAVLVIVVLQQLLDEAGAEGLGLAHPVRDRRRTAVIALFLRRTLHETSTEQTRASKDAGSVMGICATTAPPSSRCWATRPAAR
jgi:hypothetical protein